MRITSPLPFLFLCCCILVSSQTQKVPSTQTRALDSLKNMLVHCKEDTVKENLLILLGNAYRGKNIDSSLYYHTLALQLANEKKDPDKKGDALAQIGWDHYLKEDHAKALSFSNDAYQVLYSGRKDPAKLSDVLCNIATIYSSQSAFPQALDRYSKALEYSISVNDEKAEVRILSSMGVVYKNQSDFNHALACYFRGLKVAESSGTKNTVMILLSNIGNVYDRQSDYFKALDYFLRALKIAQDENNRLRTAAISGNIGNVYQELNDYRKALNCYLRTLSLQEELKDKRGIAITTGNRSVPGIHSR